MKNREVNQNNNIELLKSFGLITVFFILVFMIFVSSTIWFEKNILISIIIVLFGNFFIAIITQASQSLNNPLFLFVSFWDCSVRCLAGIAEMFLYLFAFTMGSQGLTLIAGYLILKTVSIWRSEFKNDQRKEGRATAVLRLAVVFSLLISYIAYLYLP